jgi:hypothetical protein
MINTGNAAASVSLSIDPTGVFAIQPPPPVQGVTVTPNIQASPELVSTSSAAACPYTTSSTATFIYAGPVCRPFSLPSVNVQACAGSF